MSVREQIRHEQLQILDVEQLEMRLESASLSVEAALPEATHLEWLQEKDEILIQLAERGMEVGGCE